MSELEVAVSVPFSRAGGHADSDARVRKAVDANYDDLWRALRRLGVSSDAVEDAAQKVLLVFARRIDEIAEGAERSFLFGTAVRVASDARKMQSRSREIADEDAINRTRASDPNPEELLDRHRARALLDEALAALPMDLRAVFVLFEFEQMTMAAIAKALALPPGTVASRLRRAREAFEVVVADLKKRTAERGMP